MVYNDLGCKYVVDSTTSFARRNFRVRAVLADESIFEIETVHKVREISVIGRVT